jgi:hypothetical protein
VPSKAFGKPSKKATINTNPFKPPVPSTADQVEQKEKNRKISEKKKEETQETKREEDWKMKKQKEVQRVDVENEHKENDEDRHDEEKQDENRFNEENKNEKMVRHEDEEVDEYEKEDRDIKERKIEGENKCWMEEERKIVKNAEFDVSLIIQEQDGKLPMTWEEERNTDVISKDTDDTTEDLKVVKATKLQEISKLVNTVWEEDSGEGEDSDKSDRVGDDLAEDTEMAELEVTQKTAIEQKIEKPKYRSKIMEKLESMVNNSEDVFQQDTPSAEIETRKPELDHKSHSEGYNQEYYTIQDKQLPMDIDDDEPTLVIKEQYTPNKLIQIEDSIKSDEKEKSRLTKPPVPKQKPKKRTAKKQAKETTTSKDVVDYSHIYTSFYDIFNSFVQNPKYFDPSIALREMRNLYSTYISLMDSNILFSAPSFKFSPAPLEK